MISHPCEKEQRCGSLLFTLSRASNPLFDDTTTQIRIDLALFRPFDSIPKRISRDILFSGKAPKPCVFENFQAISPQCSQPTLSHKVLHVKRNESKMR
jgi:hypothetical protein